MTKKSVSRLNRLILKTPVFIALFLVLFIGVRLTHLPESIDFGSDEGRDFLTTWNIYTSRQPELIGPPSQYSVEGRQFFFGPAPYYIILPALIIGNWDPLFISYYLIILNAVVLFVSLYIFDKYIKEKSIIYLFAFFCIVTPAFITYTRSYWNPHFMFPTSILLIALLIMSRHQKKSVMFYSISF